MTPDPDQIRAARRTVATHRRRRHPDRRACGHCCWPWRIEQTPGGRPSRGCATRRRALDVLDAAGELDALGRPIDRPDGPHA